ncbi:DUF669 domain-containing protein [Bosea sp. 2YAB26]|uniref:DUF669 domain-containing protein n=1 Tax=Bosea sp. 2YAB26 TaxID=3237478 RepID=UPI003F8F420A
MTIHPTAMINDLRTHLPAGRYALELVESDYVVNSAKTGMVLKCKGQVVGGKFDSRPYYVNYTLEHEDEEAQQIGQRDFAGLRRALGAPFPEDSAELHFKRFDAVIGVRTNKQTGKPENVIREYIFGRVQ